MSNRILNRFRLPVCIVLAMLASSGCGLIYKQNIQQGNALEQEDLDELYLGMNKRQVSFVLGSPAIHDPFHQQRWDYVQTFSRRGGPMVERVVTLRFDENDLLVGIIGADQQKSDETGKADTTASAGNEDAKKLTSEAVTDAVKEVKSDKTEPEIKGLGDRKAQDRPMDSDKDAGQQDDGP